MPLGSKVTGIYSHQSPPSNAGIKKASSYTYTYPHVFMQWSLIKHEEFAFLSFPYSIVKDTGCKVKIVPPYVKIHCV
jgi:hypothetical protein